MLRLDTANFHKTNVTGWPLQYGHIFAGLSDQTVATSLDRPIYVEFDIRTSMNQVPSEAGVYGFNGRRITMGAPGIWEEAHPRTNRLHFLEINIAQSKGFSDSYNEPTYSLCRDVRYDRCFYGDGRYAEGRQISYQKVLDGGFLTDGTKQWMHIRIPLSYLFQKLKWVSPPFVWTSATLSAVYLGIESSGAASTRIEVKNYHVYAEGPAHAE